jgi:iron complex transport system substrate-binding protein
MNRFDFLFKGFMIPGTFMLFGWMGCNHDSKIAEPDPIVTSESNQPSQITIVDRLQRKVVFTTTPHRIVSLSPSTTELLFELGLGEFIVGVTEHCNYPEAALSITKMGKGTLEGISREAIINVRPDLIVCKWDSHQPLVETFERLGIPILGLGPENLSELFEEATLLGRITHHDERADALIQSMRQRLDRIQAALHAKIGQNRKRVFYEVWDLPLMTAGPDSFIGEMLSLAEVDNIFADTTTRYPRVSSEIVVERDPEVILAPTTHGEKVNFESLANRPGWENIKAIRNKAVHLIDGDQVSRCGPRLLNALEQIIDAVYPDVLDSGIQAAAAKKGGT